MEERQRAPSDGRHKSLALGRSPVRGEQASTQK